MADADLLQLYVNLACPRMTEEDFDFLACQDLQPELYFSGDDIDLLSPERIADIAAMVRERAFRPIMHAPFYDLNPGARDALIRKVSLDRLAWGVSVAADLGVRQMVIHPGYGPWVRGNRLFGWLSRAREGLQTVIDRAGDVGIRLAFENVYDDAPNDLLFFLETFSGSHLGICLDLGHFHVFSTLPLQAWLDCLGPHIFEFHIHDNHGKADEHLAVGDGIIDYAPWLAWLGQHPDQAFLTLEQPQKTHVIKSVNLLRQWLPNQSR